MPEDQTSCIMPEDHVRFHLKISATLGRVFDPKCPQGKLAAAGQSSCHAANGTRIVPQAIGQ
jgi:hypothetical protein